MRINLYVPEDLGQAIKRAGLPVAPICQAALRRALHEREAQAQRLTDALDQLPDHLADDIRSLLTQT